MINDTALVKVNLDDVFARSARSKEPIVLELGCGPIKKDVPGQINLGVDLLDLSGVDIVADLNRGMSFLPDGCIDEIHSRSFFAHLDNFELIMTEIARVLKPGGRCRAYVPHFTNPYFYSDYTHKRFFGLYTFYYFVEKKNQLRRKVPTFYGKTRIQIESLTYEFNSPFRLGKLWKKFWGTVFNSSKWMQEFYEEHMCYMIPCYAINIVFRPDHSIKKLEQ